jgi:hypothetical protein
MSVKNLAAGGKQLTQESPFARTSYILVVSHRRKLDTVILAAVSTLPPDGYPDIYEVLDQRAFDS